MAAYGLMPMYNLTAKIGTESTGSPTPTWTYSELGEGLDNIAEALNEVVQQFFFLSDDGFARNHVTGMAPAYTFTGRRTVGDAAQDFIFANKFALDTERQSSFQLSYIDGEGATVEITCDCTICNIQEWSGATTDDSAISFEIRFDGKPELETTPA
jgi:hypothetical protein|nr:MAG TPA: tail tube protein [Caudoviricetes sp.]